MDGMIRVALCCTEIEETEEAPPIMIARKEDRLGLMICRRLAKGFPIIDGGEPWML